MKVKKPTVVRLNSWVSREQKAFLQKEAERTGKSEAEVVRDAIYKVFKVK